MPGDRHRAHLNRRENVTEIARPTQMSDTHRAVMDEYLGSMRRVSEDFVEAYRAQTEVLRKFTAEVEAVMADKDLPDNLRRSLKKVAEQADRGGTAEETAPTSRPSPPQKDHRTPTVRQGRSPDDLFNARVH